MYHLALNIAKMGENYVSIDDVSTHIKTFAPQELRMRCDLWSLNVLFLDIVVNLIDKVVSGQVNCNWQYQSMLKVWMEKFHIQKDLIKYNVEPFRDNTANPKLCFEIRNIVVKSHISMGLVSNEIQVDAQ